MGGALCYRFRRRRCPGCGVARDGLHTCIPLDASVWQHGLTIVVDASPWGAGAFLSDRGVPTAWFATTWSPDDCSRLGLTVGDHRGQSVMEAFGILIAVVFFAPRWLATPSVLLVKSDSMAAIGGMERGGSTKSTHMNRVLQELALILATAPSGLRLSFRHLGQNSLSQKGRGNH